MSWHGDVRANLMEQPESLDYGTEPPKISGALKICYSASPVPRERSPRRLMTQFGSRLRSPVRTLR